MSLLFSKPSSGFQLALKTCLFIAFGVVALISHLSLTFTPTIFYSIPARPTSRRPSTLPLFPDIYGFAFSLPKCHILNEPVMSRHYYALLWFFSIVFIIIKHSIHFTGLSDLLSVSPHRMNVAQEQGFWWFYLFFVFWFSVASLALRIISGTYRALHKYLLNELINWWYISWAHVTCLISCWLLWIWRWIKLQS